MLIVRDLLVRDQRFTDLRNGLPRIPTNVLTARLKGLEEAGVVERKLLRTPRTTVVYTLTPYGRELEDVVLALGRWGARMLGEAQPDEIVTPESLVMALRSTYRPDTAGTADASDVSYELRIGEVTLHAVLQAGGLIVEPGGYPGADLIITAGPAIRAVMAGELTPTEAVTSGAVTLEGDAELFDRFAELFRI